MVFKILQIIVNMLIITKKLIYILTIVSNI